LLKGKLGKVFAFSLQDHRILLAQQTVGEFDLETQSAEFITGS
jgi:hypothetical protein